MAMMRRKAEIAGLECEIRRGLGGEVSVALNDDRDLIGAVFYPKDSLSKVKDKLSRLNKFIIEHKKNDKED